MYLSTDLLDFTHVDCLYVVSGSSCVLKWEDPHDSVVYCVDSDRKWMVISGTNRYGVVSMNPRVNKVMYVCKYYISQLLCTQIGQAVFYCMVS